MNEVRLEELEQSLSFIHTLLHELRYIPDDAIKHLDNAIKEVENIEGIVEQLKKEEI